ncbi:nuclear pore protein 84/107 [Mycotypha africana]|uniref:nuclear pore protein 84/107 n=1 Tax=Mycotypha africana TaxID=64632 RepID=UPI002301C186|nr:nuclear pore protein 84/107 [Mycotypha africana]KAI8975223.1 nuclear pore protein 84/107 [Mycotypha africana]
MCKTWEDVVWSYLNAEVEEMLDKSEHLKMTDPTPILPSGVVSLANSKDKILRSDDSRTIFHFIQACLLSNNIEKMIHGFYHAFFNTEESSTTKNDPEQQAQLLRFLSTLITYGQKLLGWKENRYSFAIISKYASLNAEPEHLRPAVIASFAAKQSAENQIRIYSHFLQNFDGDNDEYAILIRLGKQLGLDMADILQYTYTHSFKKAMEAAPIGITDMTSKTNKDPIHFELQGDITEEYLPFFKAIKYLLVDDKSCVVQQAFDAINMTIRYFLGSCKVYLARRVIDLVPVSIAEFMTIESKKDSNARKTLAEFKGHRNLVNALVDFEKWSRLMEQKPTDR